MDIIHVIFPHFPHEILNLILVFVEEDMIRHRYQIGSGRLLHEIHWTSDPIYDLESTILVRRLFPIYWCYDSHPDDKYIYFYMKEYFKQFIQEEGGWKLSD